MNSKSTSLYHAFTSILFAVYLVSCSSDSEPTLNAPENHSPVKAEKSSIPEEIKDVLSKSTCLGCHKMKTKLIGPSYSEIAKRGYGEEEIIELIKNPNPKNWPNYPPMAPITWVAEKELATIASWIKSLENAE